MFLPQNTFKNPDFPQFPGSNIYKKKHWKGLAQCCVHTSKWDSGLARNLQPFAAPSAPALTCTFRVRIVPFRGMVVSVSEAVQSRTTLRPSEAGRSEWRISDILIKVINGNIIARSGFPICPDQESKCSFSKTNVLGLAQKMFPNGKLDCINSGNTCWIGSPLSTIVCVPSASCQGPVEREETWTPSSRADGNAGQLRTEGTSDLNFILEISLKITD